MTTDAAGRSTAERLAVSLENASSLDPLRSFYRGVADSLPKGRVLEELRGRTLGHALHPLMTDLPLGTWMSASLLDLFGGRRSQDAARRLVGAGVVFAVPTAISGFADYGRLHSTGAERVGSVHAMLNGWGLIAYTASWLLRRQGRHRAGVMVALAAGGGLVVSGYLGGHLSLRKGEPEAASPLAAL